MVESIESEQFEGCSYEILEKLGQGGQATVYLSLLKKPNYDTGEERVLGMHAAKVISQMYLRGSS
jgi:small GTP-binding protein